MDLQEYYGLSIFSSDVQCRKSQSLLSTDCPNSNCRDIGTHGLILLQDRDGLCNRDSRSDSQNLGPSNAVLSSLHRLNWLFRSFTARARDRR